MKLIDHIRKMLCKHEYETKDIYGFMAINGWLV